MKLSSTLASGVFLATLLTKSVLGQGMYLGINGQIDTKNDVAIGVTIPVDKMFKAREQKWELDIMMYVNAHTHNINELQHDNTWEIKGSNSEEHIQETYKRIGYAGALYGKKQWSVGAGLSAAQTLKEITSGEESSTTKKIVVSPYIKVMHNLNMKRISLYVQATMALNEKTHATMAIGAVYWL